MEELAIVILNYNCINQTEKCVDQLISFNLPFHIIIVDNNSSDNSYSSLLMRYENVLAVDVIKSEINGGYSAGNNFGIRYAKNKYGVKYIAIMNPDVIVDESDTFQAMLKVIKNQDKCAIVGVTVIDIQGMHSINNSAWVIPSPTEFVLRNSSFYKKKKYKPYFTDYEGNSIAVVDCIAGCFFMADLEIMEKIGFLDECLFLYNEEILLGYKLKEIGYREILLSNYSCKHNHINSNKITAKQYLIGRKKRFASDIMLCKKIYPHVTKFFLFIVEYFNRGIMLIWISLNHFKGVNDEEL